MVQGSYLVCLVGNPTLDQTDGLSQCLDSTSHTQDYQQGKEGNCSRVLKAPRSQCGNWFVIILFVWECALPKPNINLPNGHHMGFIT